MTHQAINTYISSRHVIMHFLKIPYPLLPNTAYVDNRSNRAYLQFLIKNLFMKNRGQVEDV